MAEQFLSDKWFEQVDQLTQQAGDLDVPTQLKNLRLNLAVAAEQGPVEMSMADGKFQRGFDAESTVKMVLPADLARKIFIEFDQSAAMQGFMAGQIKVEGDMSQLMALQTVQPSAPQKELLSQIQAMTA